MTANDAIALRTEECFVSQQNGIYRQTDSLFARLLVLQWLAGIAMAIWISPRAWVGTTSEIHPHVWAAIFLGGVICSFPVLLIWKWLVSREPLSMANGCFSKIFSSFSPFARASAKCATSRPTKPSFRPLTLPSNPKSSCERPNWPRARKGFANSVLPLVHGATEALGCANQPETTARGWSYKNESIGCG